MNRPFWKWLLAVSLALNIGIAAAVTWNALQASPAQSSAHRHESLADHLQLTADQRHRWDQIEKAFLEDLSANWQQIRQHREALVRHIFSPAPDAAAIDREQAKIAALQDAQQRRVIAQLLAERELLDKRQRNALMELLLTRYAQEATEEELLHRD